MAVPSLMVFLSLALKPNPNRWVNIILGVIYTVIMLITMPGAWAFYIFLGVVEVVLTALICLVRMELAQAGSKIASACA
jgi:hypothetical protein